MLFSRFVHIVRANAHFAKSESILKTDQTEKGKYIEEPEPMKTLTPQELKEASFYANLEVKRGSSFSEIKAAYKSLIKQYHPDKFNNPEQKKIAEQITSKLNEAYAYFEKKYN